LPIRFTLAEILNKYDIQQIQLAEESDTRAATIHQLCHGTVKRVNVEMLNRIIPALERLTGAKHTLEDIMIYVRDEELDAD